MVVAVVEDADGTRLRCVFTLIPSSSPPIPDTYFRLDDRSSDRLRMNRDEMDLLIYSGLGWKETTRATAAQNRINHPPTADNSPVAVPSQPRSLRADIRFRLRHQQNLTMTGRLLCGSASTDAIPTNQQVWHQSQTPHRSNGPLRGPAKAYDACVARPNDLSYDVD